MNTMPSAAPSWRLGSHVDEESEVGDSRDPGGTSPTSMIDHNVATITCQYYNVA